MRVTILDGYVDEPSRLGVPPFMSPYPRYGAGAVIAAGHTPEYMTVDHWRRGSRPSGDFLFIISGALVPGKYLRAMPMSGRELERILEWAPMDTVVWHPSGPEKRLQAKQIWDCDPDAWLYDALTSGSGTGRRRTAEEWGEWPLLGTQAIKQHQDFPQPLICEIDMSYGCPHYITGGCSFCTEPLFGKPVYRSPASVIAEIRGLAGAGCTNFRLGGQSCIFSYMAQGVGETPTPKPNVKTLSELFKGINSVSGIRVMHTDNADPSVMAEHPEESGRILEMIVRSCTSGNVLSLGLESADPAVAEANNLNSTPEETLEAIRMINAIGRERGPTGLPALLPGLNFIAGLGGETPLTFELNKQFLERVAGAGLALRRINIRQVSPVRKPFPRSGSKKPFIRFREFVRNSIDPLMLERVAPVGTVLNGVFTEVRIGKLTFSRQIGTYPLLVGVPQAIPPGEFANLKVTALGSRSLTAVQYPLDINNCELSALEALPGIGRKRAIRLFRARPIASAHEIGGALGCADAAQKVAEYAGIRQ